VSEAGVEPIAHPFALTTGFLLGADGDRCKSLGAVRQLAWPARHHR
jgi:hypothetical protein